jgi:hypothetical protein
MLERAGVGARVLRDARVGRLATADPPASPRRARLLRVRRRRAATRRGRQAQAHARLTPAEEHRGEPQASLVVDVWDEDWTKLCWVIVEGRAEVLTSGAEFTRAIDQLVAKYPQYRAMGLDRTEGAVIRLEASRVRAWRGDGA